jgi:hypothetical protein
MREATTWIREHPSDALFLSLKKAVILWTIDMRSKMESTAAYIIIYIITIASAVTGIFFIRRRKIYSENEDTKTGLRMIVLWCLVMTLIAMIFIPLPRFQILLVGIYFPVVGFGISEFANSLKARKLRQ